MVSSSFKERLGNVGNGMTGGTIVVQGDVGDDAGCAMKGGKSSSMVDALRPSRNALGFPHRNGIKQINKELAPFDTVLGTDVFCLESSSSVEFHIDNSIVSSGDLSSIAITPMDELLSSKTMT